MSEVFGTKPDKDTTQLSSLSPYCLYVPGTVPRAGKLLRNISVPGTPVCQPRCSFWPSAPTLPPLTPFHRTGQQQSYRVASTLLAERVLATEACCNLAPLSLPASPAYTLPNMLNLALSKPTWVSRSLSSGLALPSWGLDGSSPLESQEKWIISYSV